MAAADHESVGLIEALGLRPFARAARQAALAVRGDATTPGARFDTSSLRQLQPRYAVPLWLGRKPEGRLVPLTNLFNYRQPDPALGWSVRVTDVLDFRGGGNTYDSHNGTDLAIPPGTRVLAAAPAVVLRVSSEFHRGGRKVVLDHGRGLATTYNHLARPLVAPGDRVRRGQVIALSGYSGLDALVGFPWTPPHVHFNVWHNGAYVDPFAAPAEVRARATIGVDGDAPVPSIWRHGNEPRPASEADLRDDDLEPSRFDDDAIAALLAACRSEASAAEIRDAPTAVERAGAALMHMNYFPTRFDLAKLGPAFSLYRDRFPREARIDLPFSSDDYDGVFFPPR
jgi:murein DD-endopeptidase MepM/ murein hydrolase activator NlpD